ncbi:MAG: TRAP transporter TatT component family protein [Burkholderiales bacterium]
MTLLAACSPRQFVLHRIGDELAGQGQAPEDDLQLAREAAAFYLKLSESILRREPGNLRLAEAVAGGFTRYAYAFVSSEADRVEATSARAAHALRIRAAKLYRRALGHAMASLEHDSPGFAAALARTDPTRWPRIAEKQAGVAYWAAASWGGLISLSKDNPEVVADLPLAIRLASLAYARSPTYGEGALASLMGTFEAGRPGGSATRAAAYFDQAAAAGGGRNAGIPVARAEALAQPAGDRAAFETLLRQALAEADARRDLQNEVMRDRAQWLLDNADDLF